MSLTFDNWPQICSPRLPVARVQEHVSGKFEFFYGFSISSKSWAPYGQTDRHTNYGLHRFMWTPVSVHNWKLIGVPCTSHILTNHKHTSCVITPTCTGARPGGRNGMQPSRIITDYKLSQKWSIFAGEIHRVSKNKQIYFCYNYLKLPLNPTIFGTMMANCLELYDVHSFSTSSNSCQCTTVLIADVPNCHITR